MRYVLTGAVALIVGVVLGIVPGRMEVSQLQAQVAELEDAPCKEGRAQAIQDLIIRSAAAQPNTAPSDRIEPAEADPAESDAPEPDEVASMVPDVPEEQVEVVKEALSLRRAQARAALREQVRPSQAQQAELDEAFDVMNRDLDALARDVLATLDEGEPTRRDMMEFAAEALDVVLVADDAILNTLSEAERAGVSPETLDPLSYIDPELVDAFQELGQ